MPTYVSCMNCVGVTSTNISVPCQVVHTITCLFVSQPSESLGGLHFQTKVATLVLKSEHRVERCGQTLGEGVEGRRRKKR